MAPDPSVAAVEVNGRTYAWPHRPLVAVCIDGSAPAYIDRAVADGAMPFVAGMRETGTDCLADAVLPSFTNPNNLSIVTGAPPSVHGICGNYFYDRDAGEEVMMNEPRFLRAETVLAAFAAAGASVAVVTAKDKLRALLGHGLPIGGGRALCFSAEKADSTTVAKNGIEDALGFVGGALPSVYSAQLSEFVFAAGVKLLARERPDIMYLSTTDYVQHKHAPGTPPANAFYAMIDGYVAQLCGAGATVALTADHGMNPKHDGDHAPCVIYLQDVLDQWLGPGTARVILPITDPYVRHHGALGSFATAYLPDGADTAALLDRLSGLGGIECALDRATACRRFELPEDRMGDVVIVSDHGTVLGSAAGRHDLSGLDAPLRSHGGIAEQRVPLIINRPVAPAVRARGLRNFDLLDLALNHVG